MLPLLAPPNFLIRRHFPDGEKIDEVSKELLLCETLGVKIEGVAADVRRLTEIYRMAAIHLMDPDICKAGRTIDPTRLPLLVYRVEAGKVLDDPDGQCSLPAEPSIHEEILVRLHMLHTLGWEHISALFMGQLRDARGTYLSARERHWRGMKDANSAKLQYVE